MSQFDVAWDILDHQTKRVPNWHGGWTTARRELSDLTESERRLLIYHHQAQHRDSSRILSFRLWRWHIEIF